MKKILALVLSVSMLVLSACSSSSSTATTEVAETTALVQEDENRKTLTLAVNADLNTLQALNMEQANTLAMRLVYEGLVTYRDGAVQPLLAESWSFDEAGTELNLQLRKNVSFHDGSKLTAEGVKKWLVRCSSGESSGSFIMFCEHLESIEIVDEYSLKLKFSAPFFNYMEDLCYSDVMVLVPESLIDLESNSILQTEGVIGTGPYKVNKKVDGEYTSFIKNEDYWGDLSQYPYDEIVIKTIQDEASRLLALQNGEVDALYGTIFVSEEQYQQAIKQDGLAGKESGHYIQTRNVVVNCASAKLGDLRVREAIEYAIDKQALSDGLTYGMEPVADFLFPKELPYCNVETKVRSYNVEKANALLDEAGWIKNESTGIREKDGETLNLIFTYDSTESMNKPMSIALQSMLAEVGISLETTGQDMYVWWNDCVAGAYDLTIWNVSLEPHTVPNRFFLPWTICTAHTPSLEGLSDNAVCKELISEFSVTADEAKVTKIFADLMNYSANNVINIPLLYGRDIIVYRTDKVADYAFPDNTRFFEAADIVPAS